MTTYFRTSARSKGVRIAFFDDEDKETFSISTTPRTAFLLARDLLVTAILAEELDHEPVPLRYREASALMSGERPAALPRSVEDVS